MRRTTHAATNSKDPSNYGLPDDVYAVHAEGAWVTLSDGRRYVDLTSGLGAVILGHQYRPVAEAVRRQLRMGVSFPVPSALEERAAETLLTCLTWERAEVVRFAKSGHEATHAAIRLARAVTGKRTVLYCDYHGMWSVTEPPKGAGSFPYDLRRVTRKHVVAEVERKAPACVIMEPSPSNDPSPDPVEWAALRAVCDEAGTLLILDEMVTGFRMAVGGGAQALGIEPDLACYGKAMANGLPLSAVVGPRDMMMRYADDVFFSVTHGGEALSLAAAIATMEAVWALDVPQATGELGERILRACPTAKAAYPQRVIFEGLNEDDKAAMRAVGVLCAGYANLTWSHAVDSEATAAILGAAAWI